MKKLKIDKKRGFTLMEILVYIAVLAMVILASYSILTWAIHSNTRSKAVREVTDNLRRVMEIFSYEIKEAESVYAPTTTSTQLSLETKHYLPEGETLTYIDFYLCEKKLCLKKESQNPISLTSDQVEVNNLEFLQIATTTPSIQISLEINYKNPQNRPELRASINTTSTFSLRSY